MAFVAIDRNIVNHWIYQDAEYFKVWFEMLHCARYSEEPSTELVDGTLVEIKQGEFIFGRLKWSKRLGISESRLRTLMSKLIKCEMIELTRSFPKFTVYNIKNWLHYRQQSDQQQTQSQQGVTPIVNQQNNGTLSNESPAGRQQIATKEEGSNKDKQSKQSKQGNKKPIKEYSSETLDLTNHLIDLMQLNNPNVKIPDNLNNWHDAMDKLQRIDKYEYMKIRSIIDFCQNDNFWKSNILSTPKLREKIGTLVLQMDNKKGSKERPLSQYEKMSQRLKEEEAKKDGSSRNYETPYDVFG